MNVLVTGSQGFIGSYICQELLDNGYNVVGIDDYSKYGKIVRPHDSHPQFTLYVGKVQDVFKSHDINSDSFDFIIAGAAMIGGIAYFHEYAYDLLAENERITASTFDFAINHFKSGKLKRIIALSSSMVFESTSHYPTKEVEVGLSPPPMSTYGFQKLAVEYFCRGAYEQYGLPFTIIRPFNCIGVGENESLSDVVMEDGQQQMMMSHVVPDLIQKALSGGCKEPLAILGSGNQIRHYTNGRDVARGIRIAMESKAAINEDFNISSSISTSVGELAKEIWKQLYPNASLKMQHCRPFKYDVQKRIPDTNKAKNVLGFEAEISLETSIGEVISWIKGGRR